MPIRRNPEPGRQAVLWLATAFVTVIGAGGCAFIILAAAEQRSQPFVVWGVMFGAVALMLLSLAGGKEGMTTGRWKLWLASRRRTDPKTVLRIGRKKRDESVEFGTARPPTLESVREASELNVTWVPHGPPPDRARPR